MLAIGDGASAREHLRMTVLKDNSQNPVGAKLLESARKMADTWDEYREAKQGKKWEVASRALDDLISQCEGGETIELFVARTELAVISRDWETALRYVYDLVLPWLVLTNLVFSLARKAEQASPEALYTAAWVFFLTFNAPEALECMHSIQALDPQHQKTLILHSRLNLLCKRLLDLQTEQNSNGTTTQEYSEQLDLLIDFLGDREEDGRGGALRSTLLTVRAERSIQVLSHPEDFDPTR
ncbi:hypothetical protein SISSUDRAFT_916448 [Sistotremastrum suecicum HHB10207 ss-3]|uniref:Uncharacterized protein n=1 Tax=Sistotremastrum suecicum HHB10207 ss-3 TaxID=1314776 RepID=A0A166BXI6_9AGAM|nr:hypothetical protein SISSUDRAFT_916448 [Sistotremastrum suecicum HHB10207 ss-3]